MKKTFVILVAVALLGVLATTFAPGQKGTGSTAPKTAATTTPVVPTTTPAATASVATTATPAPTGQYKDGSYMGASDTNRYDNIQVLVTVSGGKITAIATPTLTGDSGRSQQINSYAIPQLISQTISAQSSQIDGVSGASYTSEAYVNSLQSALDQAKA
jgi:uncharacterized protein with FMN-binding domain